MQGHSQPLARQLADQPKPRLDGSVHDDREPAPARPGFLSSPYPSLSAVHHVSDYIERTGCVVIDLDDDADWELQLFSEEQARALLTAAAQAAAMFAAAKAPQQAEQSAWKVPACPLCAHSQRTHWDGSGCDVFGCECELSFVEATPESVAAAIADMPGPAHAGAPQGVVFCGDCDHARSVHLNGCTVYGCKCIVTRCALTVPAVTK